MADKVEVILSCHSMAAVLEGFWIPGVPPKVVPYSTLPTILSSQAFPVRIFYDRLTGNVRDLDGTLKDQPLEYGASDLQRETTLLWLRQERLLLFRR